MSRFHAHPESGSQPSGSARLRLLLVEPDPLTAWSIQAFLARWFAVQVRAMAEQALAVLQNESVDWIVLSGDLPAEELLTLHDGACTVNPDVKCVLLDSGVDEASLPLVGLRIEKPFQLADLALLLGVPAAELDAQSQQDPAGAKVGDAGVVRPPAK